MGSSKDEVQIVGIKKRSPSTDSFGRVKRSRSKSAEKSKNTKKARSRSKSRDRKRSNNSKLLPGSWLYSEFSELEFKYEMRVPLSELV